LYENHIPPLVGEVTNYWRLAQIKVTTKEKRREPNNKDFINEA
jgi:hypothetical protein